MATRKEFHLLQLKWDGPIGRNSVMGGTIVGDYIQSGGERTIVVKMPKVEKKAPAKKAVKQKKTIIVGTNNLGVVPVPVEVTHGA